MGGQLGALMPGYLADVILVNIHGLHTAPNYLLLDNLVYCCTGRDVDTVIVNGEIVVQGGRLLRLDEDTLIREVEDAGRGLLSRAIQKETDLAWLWKDRPSSLPE